MPMFTYKCRECEEVQDRLVRGSDPAPKCNACGANSLAKQVSAPGFSIYGEGVYSPGTTYSRKS